MPSTSAIATAAAFALVGLLPLAGRRLARPGVWLCAGAGLVLWFVGLQAPGLVWDEGLGPLLGMARGTPALVFRLLIAAIVGELVKALVPLLAVSVVPTDAVTALAYGAAAGAGYGAMATVPDLARTLELMGSPIVSPASTAVALAGWLFVVLAHTGTTALVARAGVRGGLGPALVVAVVLQFALALAGSIPLPLVAGIPARIFLTAVAAVWLVVYLAMVRAHAGTWSVPAEDTPP
jgi:hypothetical protein